jgi:hypothetical protein
MSSNFNFDKYMQDLQEREQARLEQLKQLQEAEEAWCMRERTRKYQEHHLHRILRAKK